VSVISQKAINIKIDSELYKRIKMKVVINDTTLKDYVMSLILKDLENDEQSNSDNG